MKLEIVLEPSDEGGYTVTVPALPGCISEGDTREDALKNIREAIQLYMDGPIELEPDNSLTVAVPNDDEDRKDWLRLSALGLENAYGEDEPEYSLDLIKEPNLEFEPTPSEGGPPLQSVKISLTDD